MAETPEEALKLANDSITYSIRKTTSDVASLHERYRQPISLQDIAAAAHAKRAEPVDAALLVKFDVVDVFARRLQVQERLTTQIKECIQNVLHPLGVAVVIEAQHLCMSMRGVQKQNSVTTTSDFTGGFLNNPQTRMEFLRLIGSDLH